jgi:hypothetical protein
MKIKNIPDYSDIEKAHQTIHEYAHRTPVLTSSSINKIVGADLFFKCENFQKVGAFKFRGACNAVFSLSQEEMEMGVAGLHCYARNFTRNKKESRGWLRSQNHFLQTNIAGTRKHSG